MSTIPAPDIFRDTLDEYTRSTELNQAAEQLRQNQAVNQQNIALSKQQMEQSAALAPSGQQQAEQNAQATTLENQQRQIAMQQQEAQLGAQKKNLKKDDSGKIIGFDNEGYQRDALAAGVPLPQITAQRQALTEAATKAAALTKDQLANHETELDQHFQTIEGLRKIPAGPQREQAYQKIVNKAGLAGDDISQYPTQIGDDANVDQIEAHLGMTKQAYSLAKEQSEITKNLRGDVGQQELNSYLSAPNVPGEKLPVAERTPASFVVWKGKQAPAAIMMGNQLTPEALQQAAQKYLESGEMAPGLARSPGTTAAVINHAAKIGAGQDLASNKASFKANQSSLTSLQKNFDTVSAFENTAGKNLDVFLNQAKKVVDSGSPWINKPLRSIDASGLGSEDQAAFNAARVTAITEIAKVLNSSNASGVLSDSARHEVEGLIGPSATLKQIVAAANVLKTDMGNRHQSYQMQIQDIQKRMGGAGNSGAPAVGTVEDGHRFKGGDPSKKDNWEVVAK